MWDAQSLPCACTTWNADQAEYPDNGGTTYLSSRSMQSLAFCSGVEHLLRDVKDSTVSNLTSEVSHMASGLRALKSRLTEVQQYLSYVLEGRLPVNHDIMYGLQVWHPSINPEISLGPLNLFQSSQLLFDER